MDEDIIELKNIESEKATSELLLFKSKQLYQDAKELKKAYKDLLKKGRKLSKIIKKKELENKKELEKEKNQENLSINELKKLNDELKKQEVREASLSREEAALLVEFIKTIESTANKGQEIIASANRLKKILSDAYEKNLMDYNLEDGSSKKI